MQISKDTGVYRTQWGRRTSVSSGFDPHTAGTHTLVQYEQWLVYLETFIEVYRNFLFLSVYVWYKLKNIRGGKNPYNKLMKCRVGRLSTQVSLSFSWTCSKHGTFSHHRGGTTVSLSLGGELLLNLNLHKSTLWGFHSLLQHLICL